METLNKIALRPVLVPVDGKLLERVMGEADSAKFSLHLGGTRYEILSAVIADVPTPVNEPTTRGGAYFEGRSACRMRGTVRDVSIISQLTEKMLGPNTEFGNLEIEAILSDGTCLKILANLTNSVQRPDSVELHMVIVSLSSA